MVIPTQECGESTPSPLYPNHHPAGSRAGTPKGAQPLPTEKQYRYGELELMHIEGSNPTYKLLVITAEVHMHIHTKDQNKVLCYLFLYSVGYENSLVMVLILHFRDLNTT